MTNTYTGSPYKQHFQAEGSRSKGYLQELPTHHCEQGAGPQGASPSPSALTSQSPKSPGLLLRQSASQTDRGLRVPRAWSYKWLVADTHPGLQHAVLCSAAGEKLVFLWSMRSYTLIQKLEGHQSSVVSCDFSLDSALLVTASYDTKVIMWDPYTGERLRSLHHTQLDATMDNSDVHMSSLRSVCFSPKGLYLATVADDRLLRIWALELKAPIAFAPMTNGLCCTFFSHGGVIATGTRDSHVQFWTGPRVLSSLEHLCRKALRSFLTTYQVLALPIPNKMKEFLTYRTF
ncbi:WD repeat and SOCS box-containing protein 2 [Heterocephalus glaber]|uniref:WD repeat and SOCS box-containing protein 2 n=1 Tax=Heterocephalus glaber TaxID=10181 RepID=G5ARH7_HETGA|nr:WD repeat and SOCS box-containing protein 2 [Heterocephalus glaber]